LGVTKQVEKEAETETTNQFAVAALLVHSTDDPGAARLRIQTRGGGDNWQVSTS
jgi:hypothetical protein